MLKTYPDIVLDYAVAGVVQAASLGHANRLRRLQAIARDRARQQLDDASAEAAALQHNAICEGYRQGMQQAMASLLPVLEALQHEQQHLLHAIGSQVQQRLRTMTNDPVVLVPQWLAACDHVLSAPSGGARDTPAVLHVPEHDGELLRALQAALADAGVQVRPAARQAPLLEVGALAYTLDMSTALRDAVDEALHDQFPRLQPLLADLANDYAQRLQADLYNAHHRQRFAAHESHHVR